MESGLTFGEWLKRRRGGLGLTQKELARQVGYAVVTLRKIEADELRPSYEMAMRLAEALQVPAADNAAFVRFARDEAQVDEPGLTATVLRLPPRIAERRSVEPDQASTPSGGSVELSGRLKVIAVTHHADWGEAPDIGDFQGRGSELALLHKWLVQEGCKIVALLGMGGIGKTALATQVAANTAEQFAVVVWRSLRNAPPLMELLGQCIQVVTNHAEKELPNTVHERQALLMDYLRGERCLVILDNFETILQGERAGHYLPGYEGYGEFLRNFGEGRHQSSLLLTSREKPKELIPLARERGPVRVFTVPSLPVDDSRALLQDRGLSGSAQEWAGLWERYSGNPLALQIVAETIYELFAGDIGRFLAQDTLLFGGINDLLAQQFARLTPVEQEVMFWLAIEREPVTADALADQLIQRPQDKALLSALHSLRHRSLIERVHTSFTLQNVVLEFTTAALIEKVCEEIRSGQPDLLLRYPLLKATAKSYISDSQRSLILGPIARQLAEEVGASLVPDLLARLLVRLRSTATWQPGYGGGSILNLLVQLGSELRGWGFSDLAVWQADLRSTAAQDVDFRHADLSTCVFADLFGGILTLAFQPDGRRIAAGTSDGDIWVWGTDDGRLLLTWEAHQGWVLSICFSPEGDMLASASEDHLIRLWSAKDGQLLASLHGNTSTVLSVCFRPGGGTVASGNSDSTVRLWDIHTGQCNHVFRGHTGDVNSVCFSPNGAIVASGSADRSVRLWDAQTGECLYTLEGHTGDVTSVCFHAHGRLLASGSIDTTINLWDVQTGRRLNTLHGHTELVFSVSFSPDGTYLAGSGADHKVRLWDPYTGRCLQTLQGHTNWVRTVAFSQDVSVLASGGDDPMVGLWDPSTGRCLHTLQGHVNWVRAVNFSPDGRSLATGSDDLLVQLWSTENGECRRVLRGHTGGIWSICFSPDGSLLATSSSDQSVRLWDTDTGQCRHVLQGHERWVWSAFFSSDGSLLATRGGDHYLRLWDPHTGLCRQILEGHTAPIVCASFSPDGSVLASGSVDCTVRLWDTRTGQCLCRLAAHAGAVWELSFDREGKFLATGGADHAVRLWMVQTGQVLHVLEGHQDEIETVRFSPDASVLASCSVDRSLRLWDPITGMCMHVLLGHTASVRQICFTSEGDILASGSNDGTIRLWDVHTGRCLHVLTGHTAPIRSISIAAGGRSLASGSSDGTARMWDLNTGACLHVLRRDRPYERMNIVGATGLTAAQRSALRRLGAVDYSLE